jgi:hypothetical protein
MGIVNGIISWNVVFRSKKGRGFRIITKDTFVLQLQEHMERPQLKYFGTYYESEPMLLHL